jgi:hypothetical protein
MTAARPHPVLDRMDLTSSNSPIWTSNLVERFMTFCEDVAGGMGSTRAVG